MPEKRLERTREAYQIVDCKLCGKPTTSFESNHSGICGGCNWKIKNDKLVASITESSL